MDEVKDAVEHEEDSGMNQLFPNNGFIYPLANNILFSSRRFNQSR